MDKRIIILFVILLFSNFCFSNNEKSLDDNNLILPEDIFENHDILVGKYPYKSDSMTVLIRKFHKEKIVLIEFENGAEWNKRSIPSTNYLYFRPNDDLDEFVDALKYMRKKAKEWNKILKDKGVTLHRQEFSKADFPRCGILVDHNANNKDERTLLYKKSFVKKTFFNKQSLDDYEFIFQIHGSINLSTTGMSVLSVDKEILFTIDEFEALIKLTEEALILSEQKGLTLED